MPKGLIGFCYPGSIDHPFLAPVKNWANVGVIGASIPSASVPMTQRKFVFASSSNKLMLDIRFFLVCISDFSREI